MVNWDTEDVRNFKKEARVAQREFCDNIRGDEEWQVIESGDWSTLRAKVEFGIYGPFGLTTTSQDRLDVIQKICDQLVKNLNFENKNINFGCIFIFMKVFEKRFTVPVFKAKREYDSPSQCIFVDTNARKYANWDDYLNYNTLRKCIYCYPAYGFYERHNNNIFVRFGTSPTCDLICRVFRTIDVTSTVVNLAAFVIGIAVLCDAPLDGPIMTIIAAVAGVSTNVYGISRSIYSLYDRVIHSQSISLLDYDARSCWLSILASSLEFTQGQMIVYMTNTAKAGELTGMSCSIIFMIIQTANLITNGMAIVHGMEVIAKSEKSELKALDVFQFSASVMFFMNAAINFKTANTIIKEGQHDVIKSHRDGLSENARKLFDNQTGKLLEPDEMFGNAKVVKEMKLLKILKSTH